MFVLTTVSLPAICIERFGKYYEHKLFRKTLDSLGAAEVPISQKNLALIIFIFLILYFIISRTASVSCRQ